MLLAIFRLLVHTSCTHVVLCLNPVWNRALFEECFAHQQRSILTSISYLGVTSQNSETLTCYMNINFILAEFKQRSEKNQGAYFIRFLQAENWSLMLFSCSVVSNSLQPHRLQHASLSFTIYQSLLKLMFIMLVMLSNHLVFCHPFLLLPSVFETEIVRRQNSYSLWAPWLKFFLQEFSYVFFQVCPFLHIIANNRIRRNQFETTDCVYPDKLNTKEPVGTAKTWGPSF